MDRIELIRIGVYGRCATKVEQQNTTVLIKTSAFCQVKQARPKLGKVGRVSVPFRNSPGLGGAPKRCDRLISGPQDRYLICLAQD